MFLSFRGPLCKVLASTSPCRKACKLSICTRKCMFFCWIVPLKMLSVTFSNKVQNKTTSRNLKVKMLQQTMTNRTIFQKKVALKLGSNIWTSFSLPPTTIEIYPGRFLILTKASLQLCNGPCIVQKIDFLNTVLNRQTLLAGKFMSS